MRIVGGTLRGRALKGPSCDATRPTTDRLRQALFNVLTHAYDDAVADARVLDLFAGTGALGLEALSRGAAFTTFVEEANAPQALIRANVAALGLTSITRILRRDATRLGACAPGEAYRLIFCDPPYGRGLADRALVSARSGGWLMRDALVVVEEKAGVFAAPEGFTQLERRRYDDTEFVFLSA